MSPQSLRVIKLQGVQGLAQSGYELHVSQPYTLNLLHYLRSLQKLLLLPAETDESECMIEAPSSHFRLRPRHHVEGFGVHNRCKGPKGPYFGEYMINRDLDR